MTDLASIPTWPLIKAVTRTDGSGELTINGTSHPIETTNQNDARSEIIRRVTETSVQLGRPVHVATSGPTGNWPIIVHPDGRIEHDDNAATEPESKNTKDRTPPATTPTTRPESRPTGASQPAAPPAPTVPVPNDPEPGPDQTSIDIQTNQTNSPKRTYHKAVGIAATRPRRSTPTESNQANQSTPDPDYEPIPRRSFLTQKSAEEPASRGWRGFANKMGMHLAPGSDELGERNDARAVSQHWPGPRTIAIVNGKGGASKTPTTILLSAVFATFGGAGVLAWDNNQTRGTLGWRTEQGPHDASLFDLLGRADHLLGTGAQSAELAHYVHHQTSDRYDVLRSRPAVLADEQRLNPDDVDAIWRVAAKYYRLILMDSGNEESDPMWKRMIDTADQLVVATTTRDDHAEAGALLLEELAQRSAHSAQLAEQAVTVVSQADLKATSRDVQEIVNGYSSLAREVVTIPHDPAMVDGILRYSALRPTTQRAWLAAGAAVARGL